MKFAMALATLALSSSLAATAIAQERQVVVLNVRGNAFLSAWPEGSRAIIAELTTSESDVLVRPSTASTFAALMRALELAASEENSVGAVCVGKSGSAGIAYVWLRGGTSAIRVEDDLRQGAVAEGAVALRVAELLHVRNVELPRAPKPEEPSAPPKPEAAPAPVEPQAPGLLAWVGAGALVSSDAEAPVPVAGFGVRLPLGATLALEGAAASTFGWMRAETPAGSVEVDLETLTLHALFDPWAERSASVSFGLGGGVVHAAALAEPADGFAGRYDSTLVGLVSARVGAAFRTGSLSLVAFAEPGLTLPALSPAAGDRALAELGRPWFSAMIGLGLSP